jgi:hypothetical protein
MWSSSPSSPTPSRITHWLPTKASDDDDARGVDALCLGTGRFLRAVLVPALVKAGLRPALIQPRGRSFLEFMTAAAATDSESYNSRNSRSESDSFTYPVDTVDFDGTVTTEEIPCWGVFSMGSKIDKRALVDLLQSLKEW